MKKVIDALLVVEGKSDVSFLSNYIDAKYVITNGSEISKETISFIKKASETMDVIVLTDPDSPGKRIRDILDQNIPNLKHCFVRKEFSIKHGKVGVAECDINEVFHALDNLFVNKSSNKTTITINDLYLLGLSGQANSNMLRQKVSEKLCLGYNNTKSLCKRLNALGVTYKELENIINE